jgi:ABC-type branched-subunit amino acid transport system substrate-binding protein
MSGLVALAVLTTVACSSGSSSSSSHAGATQSGSATTALAAAKSGPPISIALIDELSGIPAFVSIGQGVQAGFKTAVATINAAGGVNGRALNVNTYDAQTTPGGAQQAIRQAIADKNEVIGAYMVGADAVASLAVLKAAAVPLVWTSSLLTGAPDYMFSVFPTDTRFGDLLAEAVKGRLGGSLTGKTVVFEGAAPSSSIDNVAKAFQQDVESQGGKVVSTIRDPSTVASWASQAANVVSSGAQAVASETGDASEVVIAKALGIAGFKGPIISSSAANADATFAAIDSPNFFALRDTVIPQPGTPLFKATQAAGVSTDLALSQPNFFGRGYAAGWVIERALAKCSVPCSATAFSVSTRALGKLDIPMNPFVGQLDFSQANSGVNFAQVWQYDAANKQTVAVGDAITTS